MQSLEQLLQMVMSAPAEQQTALLRSLGTELPVNTSLPGGRTPLMLAAQHGCVEAIGYLLRETRADPNVQAPLDGFTALHCAAAGGSDRTLEAISLLLGSGADRDLPDAAGRRPVDVLSALMAAREADTSGSSPSLLSEPEIDVDAPEYKTADFRMFSFKVANCPLLSAHDWTECPYAHPGEKARRRDPQRFHYSGVACPDFRKGTCKRGDGCEYAHGVFECWLHPSRYRTQVCKDGATCTRKVCFFAHSIDELRQSPEDEAAATAAGSSGEEEEGGAAAAVAAAADLDKRTLPAAGPSTASFAGSETGALAPNGSEELCSAYSSAGPSSPRAAASTIARTRSPSPSPSAAAAVVAAAASAAEQRTAESIAAGVPMPNEELRAIHEAAAAATAAAAAGGHVSSSQLSLLLNGKPAGGNSNNNSTKGNKNTNSNSGDASVAAVAAAAAAAATAAAAAVGPGDDLLSQDERLARAVTSLAGILAKLQVDQQQMLTLQQIAQLQQQGPSVAPQQPVHHISQQHGAGFQGASTYRDRRKSATPPYTPPLSPHTASPMPMRSPGFTPNYTPSRTPRNGTPTASPPLSPPLTPPMSPRSPGMAHLMCPAAVDQGAFGSLHDLSEFQPRVSGQAGMLTHMGTAGVVRPPDTQSPSLRLPPLPLPAPVPLVSSQSALTQGQFEELRQLQMFAQWQEQMGQQPTPLTFTSAPQNFASAPVSPSHGLTFGLPSAGWTSLSTSPTLRSPIATSPNGGAMWGFGNGAGAGCGQVMYP